ncbi:MAG: GntP family permease [Phaeodactylibacter sp.]|uniref:GntP family permease n=1 Tax=Phaeodactylibacter sp. TaxID=1940289 RepID=UPI0032EB24C2
MLTGLPLFLAIIASIALIIVLSARLGVHPLLSLLSATFFLGLVSGMPLPGLITAVNDGFGGLMGYIGLIVVFGSIIGYILEKSGAAHRLAIALLSSVGQGRPALTMSAIGAITSIPVFCDSGFIILSGLNDAVARQSGVKKGVLALSLSAGLYTTHTLVPPTPGPIAAAGNLGAADYLGTIMLLGLLVALPTMLVAVFLAKRLGQQLELPEMVEEAPETGTLPSLGRSVLPLLLPILLIAAGSVLKLLGYEGRGTSVLLFLSHPLIALTLGTVAALWLMPKWDSAHLSGWIGEGIKLAGPILIITGAGGAFGGVLKATPVAELVEGSLGIGGYAGAGVLVAAFLIAAFLKTAQGSSTNALVITSSLLAPVALQLGMESPVELSLLVLAIGGGAMTVSHANDSYFWVVTQFSGMEMREAYRSFTLITAAQGVTVLAGVLLLYLILV